MQSLHLTSGPEETYRWSCPSEPEPREALSGRVACVPGLEPVHWGEELRQTDTYLLPAPTPLCSGGVGTEHIGTEGLAPLTVLPENAGMSVTVTQNTRESYLFTPW